MRYIHLNPLRARLVGNITELDSYPFAGHGAIKGKQVNEWQCIDPVLSLFGEKLSRARDNYQDYIAAGAKLCQQSRLTGGGLIRSSRGWAGVQQLRNSRSFQKSDERILGDGEFVESVLAVADEKMARHYGYKARRVTLDRLQQSVATLVELEPEEMISAHGEAIVNRSTILEMFTAKEREARNRYKAFVDSSLGEEAESPLNNVYGGVILGGERFIRDILGKIEEGQLENEAVSYRKALSAPFGAEAVLSTVCKHYGITREELTRSGQGEARKVRLYLVKKHTLATTREIGGWEI